MHVKYERDNLAGMDSLSRPFSAKLWTAMGAWFAVFFFSAVVIEYFTPAESYDRNRQFNVMDGLFKMIESLTSQGKCPPHSIKQLIKSKTNGFLFLFFSFRRTENLQDLIYPLTLLVHLDQGSCFAAGLLWGNFIVFNDAKPTFSISRFGEFSKTKYLQTERSQ